MGGGGGKGTEDEEQQVQEVYSCITEPVVDN